MSIVDNCPVFMRLEIVSDSGQGGDEKDNITMVGNSLMGEIILMLVGYRLGGLPPASR